jgi:hypothetical protein
MRNGYEHVLAVTQAIEGWSASVSQADPGAFIHRGADLRHAVERSLFFEMVNDPQTRSRFAELGKVDVVLRPISLARRLRYEAANLSRLGRPAFRTARLTQKPDILFLAIHPKFVTFLKPIADALGARAAWLTVNNRVTEAHLKTFGLPAVAIRPAFTPHLVPRGPMSRFVWVPRAFDQISTMLEKLRPSVIVVPEGNALEYEVAHRAGQQHGVATIYMQHGAPAYTNPGFRNWTFADALVWGSRFVEPFAKYNPRQRFTPIGTPAVFGTPRRRHGEPVRTVGFFLQKGAGVIPAAEWEVMLAFIAWLAAGFPDIELLVREHPTQPRLDAGERVALGNPANLRFMPSPEFSLSDVLSRCDVVVASASTTLLEAIAVGAIPFILGTAYPADFPDIAGEGAAVSAPTLETAQRAMAQLLADGMLRAQLRDAGERLRPELFAATGQEGAARIAALLRRVADRPAGGPAIVGVNPIG